MNCRIRRVFRKSANYFWKGALVGSGLLGAGIYVSSRDPPPCKTPNPISSPLSVSDPESEKYWSAPKREATLEKLRASAKNNDGVFDLLIIGGGATGAGCALDAATRGLKVALVEASDFASGTSSKSTKLVHGGIRYLEKAFFDLDYEQLKLVNSALRERGTFLDTSPFLSYKIPLIIPAYSWWQVPYYYSGAFLYSIIALLHGDKLGFCGYLTRSSVANEIKSLKSDGLVGGVVYSDGAHNDARMNVLVALTAAAHGATVANYVEVVDLLKRERKNNVGLFGLGKNEIYGAICRDNTTGEVFEVHSKGVISAVGPLTDSIRRKDLGQNAKSSMVTSRGAHIIVPNSYCSKKYGMLDARSSDGRVLFILPWENHCLIGTTDVKCDAEWDSHPTKDEVEWMIDEANLFLNNETKITPKDILSIWSGIRPMVAEMNSDKDTQEISRNHVISLTENGLLYISGGKWTTFREMAQETIDRAVEVFKLEGKDVNNCQTQRTLIMGAHSWDKSLPILLRKAYDVPTDILDHLSCYYGDRSWYILPLLEKNESGEPLVKRLHPDFPYIEEEVIYAVRNEMALTPADVLCRRFRLAFVDMKASVKVLPRIVEIMKKELNWSESEAREKLNKTKEYIDLMGYSVLKEIRNEP